MNDDSFWKAAAYVISSVLVALASGAGIRRVLSRDSRDRARNDAEGNYFESAVGEIRTDRDNWRKTAEDCWARSRKLERNNAIIRARNHFLESQFAMVKGLVKLYPELGTFLPTAPGIPFDPTASETGERPPDKEEF